MVSLYLPFDPESATHESFESFTAFAKQVPFDDVTYDNIPCFAMKFASDVTTALRVVAAVLNKVFEYPELTAFECEVHEE